MTLHRYDYENQDGKMVRVRKAEMYVWAAVNMTTGEVALDDMPIFDDQLSTLSEPWRWKRFTLILSDNDKDEGLRTPASEDTTKPL